jgi:hypothetical protein
MSSLEDFGPVQENKANRIMFTKCWCHCTMHVPTVDINIDHQDKITMVFAIRNKEDIIYPFTVREIAQAQKDDTVLKKL